LEIGISPENPLLDQVWSDVRNQLSTHEEILKQIELVDTSASVRIYNNSVALLQLDIDISELVREQSISEVASNLDFLQEVGVTYGERLSQQLYRQQIYDYLYRLVKSSSEAGRFISREHFAYDFALASAILTEGSTEEHQTVRVNWVTRTLLVSSAGDNNLDAIIGHWLKDCGDEKLIEQAKKDPGASAIRWLNYLFREGGYTWVRNKDGAIDYTQPFADEWQAMLNAQYYYAAFESLNDSLITTLAHSYKKMNGKVKNHTGALRELSRQLERDIITANLATLEYHNNYGYYKRKVSNTMKAIMDGWDFDEAILNEVERKTELCEQRINELHNKAESRSGFYSDLLLLGIALISISAFLFQIIEYGRNMSHNVDLAVYESNTWNLIKFISERPTDFIITLSLAMIVILFGLYAWFRRLKVMD
jgi:hypothetical protein